MKMAFYGGTTLVMIAALIDVFVIDHYFRNRSWTDNIDR